MSDNDAVLQLFLRWEELRKQGRDVPPEQLYADSPDLLAAVKGILEHTPGRKAPPPRLTTLTAEEQRLHDDYEWCLNDPEVRKAYGGKVVAAHGRKIWGAGKDHLAAWRSARRKAGCPPRNVLAYVVVPDFIPDTQTP